MRLPYHAPVLCGEAVGYLLHDPAGTYVDGTVGGGGHAEKLSGLLNNQGRLICCDVDEDALDASRDRLRRFADRITFVRTNFRLLKTELRARGVSGVAGILLDLGVSSYQLDEGAKGFSFRTDDRLDMRMDRRNDFSAHEVVNTYDAEAIADILWRFGEERHSRRIARTIVASRPVNSTGALSKAVERAVGGKFLTKTLARVFQAIRIEVNQEMSNLRTLLADSPDLLVPGGRLVVIAYHSLEDRMVKEYLRDAAASIIPSGHKYVEDQKKIPAFRILTRRPVVASENEVRENPRARSAKLRAAERLSS